MKKIALSLLLALTGTSAYSESVYELAQAHCKKAETVASLAQTYRQLGMSPSIATDKLMEGLSKVTDQKLKDEETKNIFFVVQDAYQFPVYPIKELKQKAIADFAERHFFACRQALQNTINFVDNNELMPDGTIRPKTK